MRVPIRNTGVDQPLAVMKSRNGDGAKGLDYVALLFGQPVTGRTRGVPIGFILIVNNEVDDAGTDAQGAAQGAMSAVTCCCMRKHEVGHRSPGIVLTG